MSDSDLFVNAVESGKPQAIVILYGWLGSRPRHVEKYAELWRQRNCSTIHANPPVVVGAICENGTCLLPIVFLKQFAFSWKAVMVRDTEKLKNFALETAKEAAKLLIALEEPVPVIVHAFSGAGAVVVEALERCVQEAKLTENPSNLQKELILLSEAIRRGGELFDSCPAYLHLSKALKGVELGVPSFFVRLMIQIVAIFVYVVKTAICIIQGQRTWKEEHWAQMKNSDIAPRQAYIYSIADVVVDIEKLEELIAHRKKRPEAKVLVERLTSGRHCAHLVNHSAKYKALVDALLFSISEQEREEEILIEDPDMSEYQMGMD